MASSNLTDASSVQPVVWLWGLPLAPVTTPQLLDAIDRLVQDRTPSYLITANLHYAMLSSRHADLAEINQQAAYVVADGMPLVWASRWRGTPLPERVAGSDLIFQVSRRAAERGYRMFLLGGPPGVAERAGAQLEARYPGLQIVGTESPPYRELSAEEHEQLLQRIRQARPEILIVAMGQPKGERWVHARYRAWGVPVCLQLGASIDFAAGRVSRAPRWMQRTGLEWLYRLWLEPRRLFGRYFSNGLFLVQRVLLGDPRPPLPRRAEQQPPAPPV